jgi:hypothetical protein
MRRRSVVRADCVRWCTPPRKPRTPRASRVTLAAALQPAAVGPPTTRRTSGRRAGTAQPPGCPAVDTPLYAAAGVRRSRPHPRRPNRHGVELCGEPGRQMDRVGLRRPPQDLGRRQRRRTDHHLHRPYPRGKRLHSEPGRQVEACTSPASSASTLGRSWSLRQCPAKIYWCAAPRVATPFRSSATAWAPRRVAHDLTAAPVCASTSPCSGRCRLSRCRQHHRPRLPLALAHTLPLARSIAPSRSPLVPAPVRPRHAFRRQGLSGVSCRPKSRAPTQLVCSSQEQGSRP